MTEINNINSLKLPGYLNEHTQNNTILIKEFGAYKISKRHIVLSFGVP